MKKSRTADHHEKVSEHARGLLAATAHIADTKVAEARQKLTDVIESAKETVEYLEEKTLEKAKQADEFIREKPYHTAGLALAVGTLIGFCLARRK